MTILNNCIRTTFILVCLVIPLSFARVPRTDVTASGISSGGAMAVQLHMAFSKEISGCGILAGPPYYCAGNLMAATACMGGPLTSSVTAPGILLKLRWYDTVGSVDDLSNIQDDPVYIFSGKYDLLVLSSTVKLNENVYSALGANIKTNYDMPATHGFPTENFGKSCAILNLENYMNNCNFNMAYDILNHLYGGVLIKPKADIPTPLIGEMFVFNQKAFMNPPSSLTQNSSPSSSLLQWLSNSVTLYSQSIKTQPTSIFANWTISNKRLSSNMRQTTVRALSYGFDEEGFAYFPSACAQGQKCSIHVALHGCQQGKHYVDDVFATKAGYLEVAELNNIIIIFPQVAPTMIFPTNPMGCWDWWGYSSLSYATKTAPQIAGIKKMIDTVRLINQATAASS